MLIRVDRRAAGPLHNQVADAVRSAVLGGDAPRGQRLPAARELASSLGISLHTVLRAYQDLRDEGLIELRRGTGAVVIGLPGTVPRDAVRILDDAVAGLRALGVAPEVSLELFRHRLSATSPATGEPLGDHAPETRTI
jgi:GntR family transcriptional regulator